MSRTGIAVSTAPNTRNTIQISSPEKRNFHSSQYIFHTVCYKFSNFLELTTFIPGQTMKF